MHDCLWAHVRGWNSPETKGRRRALICQYQPAEYKASTSNEGPAHPLQFKKPDYTLRGQLMNPYPPSLSVTCISAGKMYDFIVWLLNMLQFEHTSGGLPPLTTNIQFGISILMWWELKRLWYFNFHKFWGEHASRCCLKAEEYDHRHGCFDLQRNSAHKRHQTGIFRSITENLIQRIKEIVKRVLRFHDWISICCHYRVRCDDRLLSIETCRKPLHQKKMYDTSYDTRHEMQQM